MEKLIIVFTDEDDLMFDTAMNDMRLKISWNHDNENENLKWVQVFETYDPEEGFSIPEEEKELGINIYHQLCRGKAVSLFHRIVND